MKPISALIQAALFASTLAAASGNAQAESAIVVMKNFDFSPMSLAVRAGTTVIWKNTDGEPHTVVSVDGTFRSPALDQDDTFAFKFDRAGTYKYVCSIHPRMTGTISVAAVVGRR